MIMRDDTTGPVALALPRMLLIAGALCLLFLPAFASSPGQPRESQVAAAPVQGLSKEAPRSQGRHRARLSKSPARPRRTNHGKALPRGQARNGCRKSRSPIRSSGKSVITRSWPVTSRPAARSI